MTSSHDEPAYEGRISGGISADIREPRSESFLRTRKLGWDIQPDPRGYPTDIVDKNLDLDKASYGPVRVPSLGPRPVTRASPWAASVASASALVSPVAT